MDRVRRLPVLLLALLPVLAHADDVRQPVGDALYKAYCAFYDYDKTAPLNAQVVSKEDNGGTDVELIKFDSANHERVPGYLLVPPAGKKHPLILVFHGYQQSKESILPFAPLMGQAGVDYAILCLDAQYHGDRKKDNQDILSNDFAKNEQAIIQTAIDYRRALDYVATRPDIDTSRVGVLAASMGAMIAAEFVALEPQRIKTAVFAVGGADWITILKESQLENLQKLRANQPPDWSTLRRFTDPIDPLNFAPHFGDRPILLINAKDDQVMPKAAAERLHAVAVGKPLVKEWVDGGHELPPDTTLPMVLEWFQQHL
jgi:dipeptidyl aminopeptidase/acylaminoacyl peptidase